MIYDVLENHKYYHKLNGGLGLAFKFLQNLDLTNIKPGKYDIQDSDIFASISKYETKEIDNNKWESHQKYIDIQYIMEGTELIGYSNIKEMESSEEYKLEDDIQFHSGKGNFVKLTPGSFMILLPGDLHLPAIRLDKSEKVIKVVVKVKIEDN